MNIILAIFAIYAITHLLRDNSGPFNILSKARNVLMTNHYVGVFFFKLLECVFCVSCWSGAFVYFLYNDKYSISSFLLWFLAGGTIGVVMDGIVDMLYAQKQ